MGYCSEAASGRRSLGGDEHALMRRPRVRPHSRRDRPRARTTHATRARARMIALALGAATLAPAAPAAAASAPSVSTGPAKLVSYTAATLTGTINPHGQDTSYF